MGLYDKHGVLLANGTVNYIKLDLNKIARDVAHNEEMCYLIEDGVTEINFE